MADFAAFRDAMVDGQLRPNGITDPHLIRAFRSVPRELFVPSNLQDLAYIEDNLKIENDRLLMQPRILAMLIQALELKVHDKALTIGCASGYSAAILSYMADTVVGLDSDAQMIELAMSLFSELVLDKITMISGDLTQGAPQQAPFDAIVIEGAVSYVPQNLFDQLADRGRLAAVIQTQKEIGQAMLFFKHNNQISKRRIFDACLPILKAFEMPAKFTFANG